MSGIGIGIGIAGVQMRGGGGFVPTFLLRDDFTTAANAPLTSPRTAEPGPGTLTLVQTDGQFSTSSGKLNFPAQASPAWGDLSLVGGSQARAIGRSLLGVISITNTSTYCWLGFNDDATPSDTPFNSLRFQTGGALHVYSGSGNVDIVCGTWAADTSYTVVIVLRTAGVFHFIKGGAFTNWTLLYVGNAGTDTPRYPAFESYSAAGTLDSFRVLDLPTPYDTDYGLATQRLSGARAEGDTFAHEANCVIEYTVTALPGASGQRFYFRMQDIDNAWLVFISGGNAFQLYELVAGGFTLRGSSGIAVAGDRVVIVADGTTIKGYLANVLHWTYSSASNFATATAGKLVVIGTTGAVSDIISWPRTLTGTAATLLDAAVA